MQNRQAERAQNTLSAVQYALLLVEAAAKQLAQHRKERAAIKSAAVKHGVKSSSILECASIKTGGILPFLPPDCKCNDYQRSLPGPPSFRTLFIIVDNRKEGSPIRRPLLPIFTCQFFFAVLYYMLYGQKPYSILRSMSASECAPHMRIVSASSALSFWT